MGVHNDCLRSEHRRDESFQGDLCTEVPQGERRNVGADGEGFELGGSDPESPHCCSNQADYSGQSSSQQCVNTQPKKFWNKTHFSGEEKACGAPTFNPQ